MKTHLLATLLLLSPAFILSHATDTIDVSAPTPGSGYTFSNHILTLTQSGPYVITGTTTDNRIVVAPNVIADITLRNVSITSNTASPLALDSINCTVILHIEGNNTLTCTIADNSLDGFEFCAGLQVEGTSRVTIKGNGSLTVIGGACAAGIGSGWSQIFSNPVGRTTGAITIAGGFITTQGGGPGGAGIGGGVYSTGGNISIQGGVVMANSFGGQGDPAGIGGGWSGNAGNIRITGGTVFAYGGTGAGIGGGFGTTDGNISITGGAVVADEIGIGAGNSRTDVSISGDSTVIIAGSINAGSNPDYGAAQVQTGISLPLTTMQALANNTLYGLTLHDTLLLHDTLPADTTRDTISVHDTIYSDTTYLRDTVHLDTIEVHDTVHIDTVTVYDTIHLDTTEVHDTLHVDTTDLHDTTLIVDTTFIPISVHDTTHFPVSVYDTTRTIAIIIDPSLPLETLSVTDTLFYDRPVDAPTYVLLEDGSSGTGLPVVASGNARALDGANGVLLEGLTAGKPFAIYTTAGVLVVYAIPAGNTYLLRSLARGPYLLYHAGKWGKFIHK